MCWEVPQTSVHLSLSLLFFMSCSALLVASSLLLIPINDYFNLRLSEMSHCHSLPRHLSYQPPLTPDLTHLCSDHLHLPISNQASLISTLHSVIHSLFSLPFTAPNITLRPCATNPCYLPPSVPLTLQRFSRDPPYVVSPRPRTSAFAILQG